MAVSEAYYTTCYIGEKGCGKTTFALGDEAAGIKSHVLEHCRTFNMKCLFIDNWKDRPGYEKIKVIPITELKGFKKGAARVIVAKSERNEIAELIYQHVRNTLIVVEDSRMIVPGNVKETPWEDLLISNKNIACGIVFMYHGFTGVAPLMYQYVDELEIFKTRQHPSARKKDMMKYDEVLTVWERVLKHKSPYYHETVNNGS
jgi:hypothetical protein